MIQNQLPILILIIPLLSSLLISIGTRKSNIAAYLILVAAMIGSVFAACGTLLQIIKTNEPIHYHLGDWDPPFGIELVIDHLGGLVLVMVSVVALLTAVYSLRPVQEDNSECVHHYYTLYALLVSGLLGMVATGDAFNLYVLLEISALSSYALLARGNKLAYFSTFKYIIMGTIGACFYLLGVGYLYIKTGSLNMADLSNILNTTEMHQSITIKIGFILMIIGIWIKMAFFPLHGWLPNAYTHTSTTSSCLIAPLMTKVSVYVMIRLMFSVFSVDYVFHTLQYDKLIMFMASIAIIVGSISALAQTDLKRMLCYIVIAEVGYMVGGVWLANGSGLTGAIYHILADGMMTLCLFMSIGAIIYKTRDSSLEVMRNMFTKMPVTSIVLIIGALSIIGIPPTCGFFSKWYLITGAIAAGQWFYIAALLFSSLINALIFFRIIETMFFPKFKHHEKDTKEIAVMDEAPITMMVPMVLAAASLIFIGIYTNEIINGIVRWAIPTGL